MKNLYGEYDCKVDSKGRFKVPSGLLKQLGADEKESGFVFSKGLDGCLELRTGKRWEERTKQLSKLNSFKKTHREYLRFAFSGVKSLEMDASERLLVPKELVAFVELGKEVVLTCIMDKIEVWPKSRYQDQMISGEEAGDIADGFDFDFEI